ncbi:GNAT family N-acetyltransferase [Streptococcus parauberis]|uniref:Acetyltransferase, GNAT family n=1 Tax=Streptococcus parauberis NCFD 2020 TaxID=873447 RepID=F1YZW9_9STRE|nr:GNAT family N-acetyltransferase [Streptococcus parauberis]EGE54099.1 acetyltransferase, GNAT family [Streptococcus parauberis NCFD 2020]RFE01458.1 Spermine/spermidine acetyltransferase [Streptococcus parauberis]
MSIELVEVNLQSNQDIIDCAYELIKSFWKTHSNYIQTDEESKQDFKEWQSEGNLFYIVKFQNHYIGFARLGNRGAKIDWLEDLFIDEQFQNRGLGTQVINILENKVKQYSESLYLEVASRNLKAMKLYRELGFDCLNSITIRKDFQKENFEVIERQKISDFQFDIKKYNK